MAGILYVEFMFWRKVVCIVYVSNLNNNSDNNDNRDGLSAESIAAGKGYSRMVSVLRGEDNHSRWETTIFHYSLYINQVFEIALLYKLRNQKLKFFMFNKKSLILQASTFAAK